MIVIRRHREGGGDSANEAGGVKKDAYWSCVDYVDVEGKREESGKQRFAEIDKEQTLERRFGDLSRLGNPRGDDPGECKGYKTGATGDEVVRPCSEINAISILGIGADTPEVVHEWFENKQNNHGWPGTTSGGRDTADGMAAEIRVLTRGQEAEVDKLQRISGIIKLYPKHNNSYMRYLAVVWIVKKES